MTNKTQPTAHAEITAPISADLRRIDDAGAQSAPTLRPEALSLAQALDDNADLDAAEGGNPRVCQLERDAAAELRRQDAENQQLRGSLEAQRMITDRAIALGKESDAKLSATQVEAKHWRTNHDNVVARLRIFTQRPDIPKELADRLPWHRELVRLQEVEAQALRQGAEPAESPLDDSELEDLAHGANQEALSFGVSLDVFLRLAKTVRLRAAAVQAAPPAPAAVAVPAPAHDCCNSWFVSLSEGRQAALRDDKWMLAHAAFDAGRAALAAAPAQAWPSECDSPELCRVHRGCAGQYETKNTCPSFAVLNPCNSAAPAQEHATQLAGQGQECGVCGSDEAFTGTCGGGRTNSRALCFQGAAPAQAQEDALDAAELEEVQRAISDFEDCGETHVGYDLLLRAANLGYLDCTRFATTDDGQAKLDAARAAQGGAA